MCGCFILYILDITGIQWLWLLLCRYFGPTMIAEHRDSYAGLYFVERNGQNGVQTAGRKGIGWMLGLPIYQLWHLIVLFCSPTFCIWGGLVPRKPLMTLRSRTVPIPNFLLFCGYIKRRFFAYYCLLNYNHIKIQFFSKVSIIHHALPSRVGRLFADILHILTCIVETSTFILCYPCFILSTLFLYYPRLSTFIYVFFFIARLLLWPIARLLYWYRLLFLASLIRFTVFSFDGGFICRRSYSLSIFYLAQLYCSHAVMLFSMFGVRNIVSLAQADAQDLSWTTHTTLVTTYYVYDLLPWRCFYLILASQTSVC